MTKESLRKKDEILIRSLKILSDSSLNQSLIFEGGCALHFIYESPRYSGDVDFVDFTITEDIEQYRARITELGAQYPINTTKMMRSGRGIRAKWGYKLHEPIAKIEIGDLAADEYAPSDLGLYVKTPSDIYTDKIYANISRFVHRKDTGCNFPFKPNDFFDITYITERLGEEPVEKDRVLKRARDFGLESLVNTENIGAMVDLIMDEKNHDFFRHCLYKSIPEKYSDYMFDKRYFEKVADHFAQYR